jgi:hypothetical protein
MFYFFIFRGGFFAGMFFFKKATFFVYLLTFSFQSPPLLFLAALAPRKLEINANRLHDLPVLSLN